MSSDRDPLYKNVSMPIIAHKNAIYLFIVIPFVFTAIIASALNASVAGAREATLGFLTLSPIMAIVYLLCIIVFFISHERNLRARNVLLLTSECIYSALYCFALFYLGGLFAGIFMTFHPLGFIVSGSIWGAMVWKTYLIILKRFLFIEKDAYTELNKYLFVAMIINGNLVIPYGSMLSIFWETENKTNILLGLLALLSLIPSFFFYLFIKKHGIPKLQDVFLRREAK